MLDVHALTMPVRCRRARSGAQRCKPMKPKCMDEAEIWESAIAPVSMPSGEMQTEGGGGSQRATRAGGAQRTQEQDSVASAGDPEQRP